MMEWTKMQQRNYVELGYEVVEDHYEDEELFEKIKDFDSY